MLILKKKNIYSRRIFLSLFWKGKQRPSYPTFEKKYGSESGSGSNREEQNESESELKKKTQIRILPNVNLKKSPLYFLSMKKII